jgi:hypothetical protein
LNGQQQQTECTGQNACATKNISLRHKFRSSPLPQAVVVFSKDMELDGISHVGRIVKSLRGKTRVYELNAADNADNSPRSGLLHNVFNKLAGRKECR